MLAAAVSLLGFALVAAQVTGGGTRGFDEALLLALRDPADPARPIGPPWLLTTARDLTALGGFPVLVFLTVATLGLLALTGRRAAAALVAGSVAGGMALSQAMKDSFDRPRPDLVPHAVEVATASFPSSHAMLSAVVYLTLGALLMRLEARRRARLYLLGLAVLMTLLVGSSRVYLGVHWPTDVLAGWCLGAGWALLCWLLALRLQRRGQVEVAESEPG
jgi:undecaprenyl-diphosphatase